MCPPPKPGSADTNLSAFWTGPCWGLLHTSGVTYGLLQLLVTHIPYLVIQGWTLPVKFWTALSLQCPSHWLPYFCMENALRHADSPIQRHETVNVCMCASHQSQTLLILLDWELQVCVNRSLLTSKATWQNGVYEGAASSKDDSMRTPAPAPQGPWATHTFHNNHFQDWSFYSYFFFSYI